MRGRWPMVGAWMMVLPLLAAFDVLRDDVGRAVHWPSREIAVFAVLPATKAPDGTTWIAAVRSAIERWNAASDGTLRLVYGGYLRQPAGFDISIGVKGGGFPESGGEPTGAMEFAANAGALLRADLWADGQHWRFGGAEDAGDTRLRADLGGVVSHLLGHGVGLAHSRHVQATMGFLPIEAAARTPEPDDAAGLAKLYGAGGGGGLCDACDGDGDCSQGGVCLRWPDQRSYCARPCSSHGDCAIGWSCGVWAKGKACLPNGGHCSPDRERVGPSRPCASDLACPDPLFCLVLGEAGMCTAACNGWCGSFGNCVGVELQGTPIGLCLAERNRPFGARCEAPADCASLLCVPTVEGGGVCGQACPSACPGGASCLDGQCVVPGTRALGWPCRSGFDCTSGQCSETGSQGICSQSCVLATDCPAGTGCVPRPGGSVCLPFGPQPPGSACQGDGSCAGDAMCVHDAAGDGACQLRCDPFDPQEVCDDGGWCAFAGGRGGACVGGQGGGPGAACSASAACRPDLVCAAASGSGGATCHHDCERATGKGCPASTPCQSLEGGAADDGPERGACAASAGPWRRVAPDSAMVIDNFAAIPLQEPSITAWQPVRDAEPDEAGCQQGQRPSRPLPLALVAALTWLCLANRRRGGTPG